MKLSTKIRYGTRAVIEMAKAEDKTLSIQWISSIQGISPSYLEQLLTRLKNAKIIGSQKGPGGGYFLEKKPCEITLYEIYTALEGELHLLKCLKPKSKDCEKTKTCIMHCYWSGLQDVIIDYLKSITIANVISQEKTLFEDTGGLKPRKVKRTKES